jgi:hypothetical protein
MVSLVFSLERGSFGESMLVLANVSLTCTARASITLLRGRVEVGSRSGCGNGGADESEDSEGETHDECWVVVRSGGGWWWWWW